MLKRVEGWHGSMGGIGRRCLGWWIGELRGMLPAPLRAALAPGRQHIRLEVDDECVRATFESLLERENIGHFSLQDCSDRAGLRRVMRYPAERVLCLPSARVLRRHVELPLATEENLRQVLGFELDRYTPLSADNACYDYRLTSRDAARRQLTVELTVVPRTILECAMEQLQSLGLTAHRASTPGDDSTLLDVNLLPVQQRARVTRVPRLVNTVLAGVAAALLVLALGLPYYQKGTRLDALMPLVQQARSQAASVRDLRESLESLSGEARYVLEKYHSATPSLQIINQITQVLPDNTWASQLIVQDGEVQIRGESTNAALLVQLLESSPLFHDVRFRSPVIEDARAGVERFHLSAEFGKEQDS